MKARIFLTTLLTVCISFFVIACGDDDDEETETQKGNPDPIWDENAITANKVYTAQIAGQNEPITLTFPAPGEYTLVQGGVTETGTVSGVTRDHNRWTLNLTPSAGSPEGARRGVLQLDFTEPDAGAWTFSPTGGTPETGTFTVTVNIPDDGVDTGGPGDRTSLSGKTLQISYAGGGGERFDFLDGSNVSYEAGAATGSYTWDQANARLNVTLNNSYLFEITIPEGSNQATVAFRSDTSQQVTDTGTYTLQ
jgi:hypothetical protein